MTDPSSPLHIGRADLLVVNGIGPGIQPRLTFADCTFTGAFAGSFFNGTNHFLDATQLAEIHALLVRIERRLR